MPLPLRAERYLPLCRNPEALKDLVARVQEASFTSVCAFYDVEVPLLTEPEQAFLGANDRFFLLAELLNRKDARHPWIYARCREVEAAPDDHLDLWARYHLKSSIGTFAGSIQEIICDPNVTIAIFAATIGIAQPFLKWIMTELEQNERLKRLYPDVFWEFPRKQTTSWSAQNGLVVKRDGNPKEATVEAIGLIEGSAGTGKHFRLLVYDDLVTPSLVSNEEMVRKVTERWEMSDNLGIGEGTRKWHFGTRYSYADTYGVILERGILTPRLYPATDNGKLDGQPVLMSLEHWEKVKVTQRSTVAAQMLQNPLAGTEATFDPHCLRSYPMRPRTMNVYIMGDPSQGIRSKRSDRTAIAVIGIDAGKNKYLLDGYCHRMKLSERWVCLKVLYKRWYKAPGIRNTHVGWERYGMQSDLQYFEEQMRQKDEISFHIAELNWTREGDQSKKSRVQRLEPDFLANSFYLPAKVWNPNVSWVDASGKQQMGPRICFWSVNSESGKIEYRPIAMDPNSPGKPMETRIEREARQLGETYRIIEPIRRKDEDGNLYDLTRMFMGEFAFFPFTPHDDLIDAVSRIYDMDPVPPMMIDNELLLTPIYSD